MFPFYVPAALGIALTVVGVLLLRQPRTPWRRVWLIVGMLGASLVWIPGPVLFVLVPHLWPQSLIGSSPEYYQLMGWEILWIFLGIPVGLIITAAGLGLGGKGHRTETSSLSRQSPQQSL